LVGFNRISITGGYTENIPLFEIDLNSAGLPLFNFSKGALSRNLVGNLLLKQQNVRAKIINN